MCEGHWKFRTWKHSGRVGTKKQNKLQISIQCGGADGAPGQSSKKAKTPKFFQINGRQQAETRTQYKYEDGPSFGGLLSPRI
jgi:hypothetical protein